MCIYSFLSHVSHTHKHTHTIYMHKCVGAAGLCELLCLLDDSLRVKIEIYCTCQMTLVAPLSLSPSLPLSLTKSSVSSKSHQLSQRPLYSIQAPRDPLHAKNIHADTRRAAAGSNRPLNQLLKVDESERQNNTSWCAAVCTEHKN